MPSISPPLRLATWASIAQATTIQEMLALTSKPGMLSFALGLPEVSLFPAEAFAQSAAQLLVEDPQSLQYGPPSQALKMHIVALMRQRGVECRPEQIFLTTGAQQAMNLLARVLLDTHGAVILEDKVYSGILQAIEPCLPTVYAIPTDPITGLDVDAVEQLLQSGLQPAFLYAMSDGHNPLGVSLNLEKRQRLVALARTYHTPIIEDDAYGMLCYEQNALPPMRALEEQWIFYVGSVIHEAPLQLVSSYAVYGVQQLPLRVQKR